MVAIRRTPPDFARWDETLAMARRAFAFMDGRIDPPSSIHRLTAAQMALDAAAGAAFVAEVDGAIVGCAFCKPKGDALYIGKLAVEPTLHGRGIGKALLDAALAEARARGMPFLELQTRVELVENHAAFARFGFIKTGETAHDGYARATSITMRRPA
ncbi:MAG: GNAT family N-acetyltransferase [Alphaproteobacteria bacterium]|nr:GNAT family N-acetyltransferase [Alphaproteobacteria bacterium]